MIHQYPQPKNDCVGKFERRVAEQVGAKHCVTFNSGTSALRGVAEYVARFGRRKVYVPSLTYLSTASVWSQAGFDVCPCDVSEHTFSMGPVGRGVSEQCIVVPMTYGGLALTEQVVGNGPHCTVVVDAAHAFGARYWPTGEPVGYNFGGAVLATMFSFHASKPLSCGGEGGAIVTDSAELRDWLVRWRSNGIVADINPAVGLYASSCLRSGVTRMSAAQAACGLSNLDYVDINAAVRQRVAEQYRAALGNKVLMQQSFKPEWSAYHLFPVAVPAEKRNCVMAYMLEQGVVTRLHYPLLSRHAAYSFFGNRCIRAEKLERTLISLPIHHEMTDVDVATVVEALLGGLSKC